MSPSEMELIGYQKHDARQYDSISVNLLHLPPEDIVKLREVLEAQRAAGGRGMGVVINDITRWLKVIEKGDVSRGKTAHC